MSAISLKSITGITSITTPAGVDNQLTLHNNNTSEAVKIDVAGNVHVNNHLAVSGVTTTTDNINIGADNKKLQLGASQDLEIFHDGGTSRIVSDAHALMLNTTTFILKNAAFNDDMITAVSDGPVKLYHDGTERLATTHNSVSITGNLQVSQSLSYGAILNCNGDVNFNGDNSKTILFDKSDGTFEFSDDARLRIGGGNHFQIFHDGTDTRFANNQDHNIIKINSNEDIELHKDTGIAENLFHIGDTDTKIRFPSANTISMETAGNTRFGLSSSGNIELHGTQTGNNVATIYNGTGFLGFYASSNSGVNRDFRFYSSNSNSNESFRISSNGNVNVYKDLDVDGHTNLDNVSVSGVTTMGQTTIAHTSAPQLIIKDSDTTGAADSNGISFQDASNTQYGFIGQTSSGGHTMLITTTNTVNPIRLQVNSSTKLEVGHTGTYVQNGNFYVLDGYSSNITGDVNLNSNAPTVNFNDSNGNPDYRVLVNAGVFKITDTTNSVDRISIASNGNVSITNDLDVDGHTNLDNVSIAGVSTFSGNVLLNGDLEVSSSLAYIRLTDSDSGGDDFGLRNDAGVFYIRDVTHGGNRFSINSEGTLRAWNRMDFDAGIHLNAGDLRIVDTIKHRDDEDTKIRFPSNDAISFETAGNQRMRIYDDGIVAIGQSAKSGTVGAGNLDIQGNATSCIIEMGNPFPNYGGGVVPEFRITATNSGHTVDFASVWGGDNLLHKHLSFSGGATIFHKGTNSDEVARFSQNKFGVGTNSPQQAVHVHEDTAYKGILINGNNAPRIAFARQNTTSGEWSVGIDGTNGNDFSINNSNDNSNRKFLIGGASSSNANTITSLVNHRFSANVIISNPGSGIDFSATSDGGTGTPSELLDDYEEGSWTPVLKDAASGGNTYSGGGNWTTWSSYTKIGNTVRLHGNIYSLTNSGMNTGNGIFIHGAPFTAVGSQICFCRLQYFNNINSTQFGTHIQIDNNSTVLKLQKMADNSGASSVLPINWGHIQTNAYFGFIFTLVYRV